MVTIKMKDSKNLFKKYYSDYDYIQQYHLKNINLLPKIIGLVINLYPNDKADNGFLIDPNNQIKYAFLFYVLLGKRPKLKSIAECKNNLSKRDEVKYYHILYFSIKKYKEIYLLLESLFVKCNDLKDMIKEASIINSVDDTSTSIVLKYPLDNFSEIYEYSREYDIRPEDYHFSIRVTFNQCLSRDQISTLLL
jgi:hypothetical protein